MPSPPPHVNEIGRRCQSNWHWLQSRPKTSQRRDLCYRSAVPDDDRKRRRLGDATKGRIADLADGWTLEPGAAPKRESDESPSPRRKQKTIPPPPPGSAARRELEEAIVDAKDSAPNLPRVTDAPPSGGTKPPPLPTHAKPDTSKPVVPAKGSGATPTAPSGPKFKRASSPAPNEIAASLSGSIPVAPSEPVASARPASPTATARPADPKPANAASVRPASPAEPKPAKGSGGADAASTSGVIEVAPKPKASAPSGGVPAIPPPRPPASGPTERAPLPVPVEAQPAPRPSASAPIPRLPPVIIDDPVLEPSPEARGTPAPADASARAKLAVPIGEFDDGGATIDEERLRIAMAQSTIVRDAADAI